MNLEQARFFMVEQQIRPWDVLDPKVLELIAEMPRHEYVAEDQQQLAYTDIELPLDEGQLMMAPKIEAKILQAIDLDSDETVLEVGTGSGYMTALLASFAKKVVSVEYFASLQEQAKARLTKFDNIEFSVGDASTDWQDGKQYDVIVLTGSVVEISDAYLNKLNIGGRLFAVVGQGPAKEATLVTRISDDEWIRESLFETELMPLINADFKPKFEF